MKTISKIIALVTIVLAIGCKKDFLNAKPDDHLVVPSGLADMQQILDNDKYMNGGKNVFGPVPSFGNASADDYYVPDTYFNSLNDFEKSVYTWATNIPWPSANANWVGPYRTIFYANTALDGLKDIKPTPSELQSYNNIKGSALFYRSFQFFNLSQVFCKPYGPETYATDLGIPLRLSPDIAEQSNRSTLKETYDRIINDLSNASSLLPNKPLMSTRPSKPAVYALLARVYLTMANYKKAMQYCDSALAINKVLLDYNKISATQKIPFALMNEEVVFQASVCSGNGELSNGASQRIDRDLLTKYAANDLRKNLFFKITADGGYIMKGTYCGTSLPFAGIANDEIILMQAECLARLNDVGASMESLNTLLKNRYAIASFSPANASNSEEALTLVLEERRKELAMRNLRWMDIRRLNKAGRNITLKRNVNGVIYSLAPNDVKYTWPIPTDVIGLTNMPQNPR